MVMATIRSDVRNARLEVDIGRLVDVMGVLLYHELNNQTIRLDQIDVKVVYRPVWFPVSLLTWSFNCQ